VDFVLDKLFGFSKEFTSQNTDGSGTITDLSILGLTNVNKNAGCWVVNMDAAEDSSAIIGNSDCFLTVLSVTH
jgi:hypothetical protein